MCGHILQEEEENEELLLALFERSKRNGIKSIYQNRYRDGYCRILIKNHLVDNRTTYKQFFRSTQEQVDFVLNCIGNNFKKHHLRFCFLAHTIFFF